MITLFQVFGPTCSPLGWLYSVTRKSADTFAANTLKDQFGNGLRLEERKTLNALEALEDLQGRVDRREAWWAA